MSDDRPAVHSDCDTCQKVLETARELVDTQAKDEGLWFRAETAPEAYLQEALRKLHEAINDNT